MHPTALTPQLAHSRDWAPRAFAARRGHGAAVRGGRRVPRVEAAGGGTRGGQWGRRTPRMRRRAAAAAERPRARCGRRAA